MKRRKELRLTQQQLGEKVGVTKSEISKIENGRGITFSTINKLSEALGVSAQIELKPTSEISLNVIHYIVMSMGMFARQFKLSKREACNYLSRYKGLEFSIDNYEAEHQLSMQDTFDKLCDRKTALYIESPAYIYETLNDEFRFGSLRNLTE